MGDQPIWPTSCGNWLQDDKKKRFFLLNGETEGIGGSQLGFDIILGAKWHRASESDCGGFFPPEFNHCPFCGEELASGKDYGDVWVPPLGGDRGLRLAAKRISVTTIPMQREKAKRWVDQEGKEFPLPRPRGDYQFIVAPLGTKSPVLLTFDRTTGLVDFFSPVQERWVSFTPAPGRRIGESDLPNWSWSAAFVIAEASPGFAVPTREGPVWIGLHWPNGTCNPIFGQGESVGGAATLENNIFVPVLVEGAIAIYSYDFVALRWQQLGEPTLIDTRESHVSRYFSVPIVDEGRRVVYWVGITGSIAFYIANRSCAWRPWETDAFPCRAVPELGPPYRDNLGNFWQICYDDHDDAFRYYKLSGDESDRENVDGGRFSSGVSCFSKPYDLWDKPWTKVDAKRQEKAKWIRAPLLCLDEETKATITANFGSGSILPLLEIVKDRGKRYSTDLRIESPHDLPIELRTYNTFNLTAPWELRLFIYQGHLFAYSVEEAICYKWRLR